MPKKKIKLALIPNDAARRNAFYRRKKGMMKKLSELSTLCGVKTCAVVYSPFEEQPDVWPSPSDGKRLLSIFKNMPEFEQRKKTLNHEEYLSKRINKMKDQYGKIHKENRRKEMMMIISDCFQGNNDLNELTMSDLTDLTDLIDAKMKTIGKRIEALQRTSTADIGTSQEDSMALQVAVNALQDQPWYIHGMNSNEPSVPSFGREVVPPYVDNPEWTAPFFP
ncbi:hypothetical protein NE237_014786 [Protea cynaroides]|uniref:MADS-box domain-containing protein n=1 Tax=Protea cynaroides TaxID=273540 RepID=A0A9Q0QQF8_9MAGN|nr:hypothetical protein NE237_014786 [Protea cynaroides]